MYIVYGYYNRDQYGRLWTSGLGMILKYKYPTYLQTNPHGIFKNLGFVWNYCILVCNVALHECITSNRGWDMSQQWECHKPVSEPTCFHVRLFAAYQCSFCSSERSLGDLGWVKFWTSAIHLKLINITMSSATNSNEGSIDLQHKDLLKKWLWSIIRRTSLTLLQKCRVIPGSPCNSVRHWGAIRSCGVPWWLEPGLRKCILVPLGVLAGKDRNELAVSSHPNMIQNWQVMIYDHELVTRNRLHKVGQVWEAESLENHQPNKDNKMIKAGKCAHH